MKDPKKCPTCGGEMAKGQDGDYACKACADKDHGKAMEKSGLVEWLSKADTGSDKPAEQTDVEAPSEDAEETEEDEGEEAAGEGEDEGGEEPSMAKAGEEDESEEGEPVDEGYDGSQPVYKGPAKMEKSGLAEWLAKAIPGVRDEGIGSPGSMGQGVPRGLDARPGYQGPVTPSRAEDGGPFPDPGKGPGASGSGSGLNARTSAAGPAYGANQQGPVVPGQVAGGVGKTDRLTEDDPKDTAEMKTNPGAIHIPGAPAPALSAQGAQRSAASQGGPAYGPATPAAPGVPSQASTAASNPVTGARGLGENRNQGGPAYGANQRPPASAPNKTHPEMGMGPGPVPQTASVAASRPVTGSPGLGAEKKVGALYKGLDDVRDVVPSPADLEAERDRAQRLRELAKGQPDVVWGLGVAPERPSPVDGATRVQVMLKGGVVYTDQADQEVVDFLEKSDFGYHGPQPGVGPQVGLISQTRPCPRCAQTISKAVSECPECGVDVATGRAPGAFPVQGQVQVPVAPDQGLRPRVVPDVIAPVIPLK